MKRKTLIILICVIVVVFLSLILWRSSVPEIQFKPVEVEVTLGQPVTRQIGTSTYNFKLYRYPPEEEELTGMYMLRVEKGTDFKTKVVVSGHTYRFLDLEVHVVKLISAGVLLRVVPVD